jgi:hypothetical protein
LTGSPVWFPLELAREDTVRLVRLDEAGYRAASFLDQRLLQCRYEQSTCTLASARSAATQLAARAHYIFHTGHVGSTLISRLVGEHAGFFSLREPALLRGAANEATALPESSPELDTMLRLLSRTWRPEQRPVIKGTSIVSELAERILAAEHQPAAVLMYTPPLAYLQCILGGPVSRSESKVLSGPRRRRLIRRLGTPEWRFEPRSEGQWIALNWLSEMAALHQAAVRFPSRVLWVNFDRFLAQPHEELRAIFQRLGAEPSSSEIEALVTSPVMRQYSKGPEHAYDAALRREVLQSADWEHGPEIRRGMDWLAAVARAHPLAQAVIESAARPRYM